MEYKERYKEAFEKAKMYYENAKYAGNYSEVARLESMFPELGDSKDEGICNLLYCIIRDREDIRAILEANGVSVDSALAYIEKQKEIESTDDKYVKGYSKGYADAMKILNKPAIFHTDDPYIQKLDPNVVEETKTNGFVYVQPAEQNEKKVVECKDSFHMSSFDNTQDIIKSLRDELQNLRLQLHWKPSEEQIKALNSIILNGSFTYVGQVQDLISLKDNLKKL